MSACRTRCAGWVARFLPPQHPRSTPCGRASPSLFPEPQKKGADRSTPWVIALPSWAPPSIARQFLGSPTAQQARNDQHAQHDHDQGVSEPGRSRRSSTCLRQSPRRCASAPSAKGPRIMPTTTGGGREVKTAHDHAQEANRVQQHQIERAGAPPRPAWRTPECPAYRYDLGMFSNLTHRPTSGRFRISSITLPMYIDAISAHTMAPLVSNSCGPGWIP